MKRIALTASIAILACLALSAQTWQTVTVPTNFGITSASFSGNTGYAVAYTKILKTTDGGLTWTIKSVNNVTLVSCVSFLSPTVGFIGGSYPGYNDMIMFRKTTDGGLTWKDVDSYMGTQGGKVYSIDMKTEKSGCISAGVKIWVMDSTYSAAKSIYWSGITTYSASYNTKKGNCIYAVGNNCYVQNLTSKPLAWGYDKRIDSHMNDVSFATKNVGYCVGDSGFAYRIDCDSGIAPFTVTKLYTGVTYPLYSLYVKDVNTVYAVGMAGTIIRTTDGGANWESMYSGTLWQLRHVCPNGSGTMYAFGDNGTVLRMDETTTGIAETANAITAAYYDGTIRVSSRADGRVELYDMTGRTVMSEPLRQGNSEIAVDAPAGAYIVSVTDGKLVLRKKIIVSR